MCNFKKELIIALSITAIVTGILLCYSTNAAIVFFILSIAMILIL